MKPKETLLVLIILFGLSHFLQAQDTVILKAPIESSSLGKFRAPDIPREPVALPGEKNTVFLSYFDPFSTPGALGLGGAGSFYAGVRFPGSMLSDYAGYEIDQVEIHIGALPHSIRLLVYGQHSATRPGAVLRDQSFTARFNEWVAVELNNPLTVGSEDVWVVFLIQQTAAGGPILFDRAVSTTDGNWLSFNGTDWVRVSENNPQLQGNYLIRVRLKQAFFQLRYAAGANGYIQGETTQTVRAGGNGSSVTAVPHTGYRFVRWSDGRTDNPRRDTQVTDHVDVVAQFEKKTYVLRYLAGQHGRISGPSHQVVAHGDDGEAVEAQPDGGYYFIQWSDGSTANPRQDTHVTADIEVTATFSQQQHIITATADNGGSISPSGEVSVAHGADQSFTIQANTGYHVANVLVDGSSTGAVEEYIFRNVERDHRIHAEFERNVYTLTYDAGEGGWISGQRNQEVPHGSNGSLVEAIPNQGYRFVQWSDGLTNSRRNDRNVRDHIHVEALFERIPYTITASAGANGSIEPEGAVMVRHGDDQHFVFEADPGYHIRQVYIDGVGIGNLAEYTFRGVTQNYSISVEFDINIYQVTYRAGANGYISGPGQQSVAHGDDSDAVEAVPDPGHHFVKWSDGRTDNPRKDTHITGNIDVTAVFQINTYIITATAMGNGSISPAGEVPVTHGSDQSFSFTPSDGHHIAGIQVDGSPHSVQNTYTFHNVVRDHLLEVSFEINHYLLRYEAGANGHISGPATQIVRHGGDGESVLAVPNEDHYFVQWSDGRNDNPRTDTDVREDLTVTALFEIITHSISLSKSPPNGGQVRVFVNGEEHSGQDIAIHSMVQIQANPGSTYAFYQWEENGSMLSLAPTHVFLIRECRSITAHFTIATSVLLPSEPFAGQVLVYPVPARERIKIQFPHAVAGPLHVRLTSLSGQTLLAHQMLLNAQNEQELNIDGLSPGLYYLQISWENQMTTLPVLISP